MERVHIVVSCCLLSSTYQIDYAHTKPAAYNEKILRKRHPHRRNAKAVQGPPSYDATVSPPDPAKSHLHPLQCPSSYGETQDPF